MHNSQIVFLISEFEFRDLRHVFFQCWRLNFEIKLANVPHIIGALNRNDAIS